MKTSLIKKLLSPLNYLRIKHEDKFWVDFYFPLIIAIVLTLVIIALPSHIVIVGSNGFIAQLNGLLQILIGFYIAALAAVATFDAKGMDDLMEGNPPEIIELRRGIKKTVFLTRRRFLCYLFGYLALICFVMFSVGLLVNLISPAINFSHLFGEYLIYVRYFLLFLYVLTIGNMVTTTLLGLYYLTVKIHLDKPKFTGESKD